MEIFTVLIQIVKFKSGLQGKGISRLQKFLMSYWKVVAKLTSNPIFTKYMNVFVREKILKNAANNMFYISFIR